MLSIKTFQFNMFGVNTYLIWNPATKEAAVIDPGMYNDTERKTLDAFIAENNLTLTQLINTHFHVDHIFGDNYVKDKYGLTVKGSADDAFLGEKAAMQCRMFGLPADAQPVCVDEELHEGDKLDICGETAEILQVPGHSPGSLVIYFPESRIAFTGDVIFDGSIGRTDLVAGNYQQLINGIRDKILPLPPSTVLYPGHGNPTTVGKEAETNPYI